MISLFILSALAVQNPDLAPPGQLTIIGKDGRVGQLIPLKKTAMTADIAGMSARVSVVQTFMNSSKTPIEAVYTFPLPADAAVDKMRMNIAGRIVEGEIKKRQEAQAIYDRAKANGQVAALLNQERPNVFTQQVANILPGATIEVEVSYVQVLKYESGTYEFSYPMVVGPRYTPASTPDPDKVTPPTLLPGQRTGTNVSVSVHLDAGAPLESVESVLHTIDMAKEGTNQAFITLKNKDEIPNKDFILRYKLKGEGIREQFFTHPEANGEGSFCLILNPPVSVKPTQVRPREVIFVMDQSGSQSGFPLAKSKELTLALTETLRATDTFNVISFSNGARRLWPSPRQNTPANVGEAKAYVNSLDANGGTEFLPAIEMALSTPPSEGRMRLVVFNTDGFVGNEYEILDRIQKYRDNSRMFTFGVGNSVNHFLIDAMSIEGKGGSQTLTLNENAEAAKKKFIEQTHSPILTDIRISFSGAKVTEVTPSVYPDLYAGQPFVIYGKYSGSANTKCVISGKVGMNPWKREIDLNFAGNRSSGAGVSTLWARNKITDLTRQDWLARVKPENDHARTIQQITDIALKYGIMSDYTSFVAVEKRVVNIGGKQRTVQVPIDMADGVTMGGEFQQRGQLGTGFGGGGGSIAGRTRSAIAPGAAMKVKAVKSQAGLSDEKDSSVRERTLEELNAMIKNGTEKPTVKIAKELLASKDAELEVQVRVTAATPQVLALLKKAGLQIAGSDNNLAVVFGTIKKSDLETLAKVAEVIFIKNL